MRRALLPIACLLLGCSSSVSAPRVEPTVDDMLRNVALDGVHNVRDLGGLRGSRGVTLDIDLRTSFETDWKGDRLAHDARFSYRHISLLGVGFEDLFRSGGLRGLYLHALGAHRDGFRAVFRAMATHEGGAVLYHCSSGKDRTGMVTAILLDLAGVSRDTIVRDYAISAGYDDYTQSASPPEAIRAFLDALDGDYGGARAYLARIGLSKEEIRSLLAKLGQA